jgi:hypothetical protein
MKKRDKQQEIHRISLCLYISSVDIYEIGYGLKSVKRDPDGQSIHRPVKRHREQHIEIIPDKSTVFEANKQRKVNSNRKPQDQLRIERSTGLFDPDPHSIVKKGCEQQEEDPHWFTPGIENQGKDSQRQVPEHGIPRNVMSQNAQGKEHVKKGQT